MALSFLNDARPIDPNGSIRTVERSCYRRNNDLGIL